MRTGIIKFAFVTVVSTLLSIAANAQIKKPGISLGANAIYSMPQGDFKNKMKFGIGGEVYAGVGWGKTHIVATLGYRAFREDVSINAATLTYLPVKVGIKQYFLLKRIFIQGDLGVANVKYKGTQYGTFAPGIGAGVRIAGLELGLYYDTFKAQALNVQGNSIDAKVGFSISL